MRKFIALGITAISAGSIVLSAGGAATAAESTTTTTVAPKTIVDDVCVSVPDVVTSITDAINGYDHEADQTAYDDAKSAAQDATAGFVSALVNYLKDVASKSANLPISTSTLQVREGQYTDALTTWSQAGADLQNHWGELEFLTLQNSALTQLNEGLACTPPAES